MIHKLLALVCSFLMLGSHRAAASQIEFGVGAVKSACIHEGSEAQKACYSGGRFSLQLGLYESAKEHVETKDFGESYSDSQVWVPNAGWTYHGSTEVGKTLLFIGFMALLFMTIIVLAHVSVLAAAAFYSTAKKYSIYATFDHEVLGDRDHSYTSGKIGAMMTVYPFVDQNLGLVAGAGFTRGRADYADGVHLMNGTTAKFGVGWYPRLHQTGWSVAFEREMTFFSTSELRQELLKKAELPRVRHAGTLMIGWNTAF